MTIGKTERETSKIEIIEIKMDSSEKEEKITLEKITKVLIRMEIISREIIETAEVSKNVIIGIIVTIEKTGQETSKIETIEIKMDLSEKEEKITLEKIIETLTGMEVISREIIEITEVSKIEITVTIGKTGQETLEIDRITEDFPIEADLIEIEMTSEKIIEITFLAEEKMCRLKFQRQQLLKREKLVEKEKENLKRKNTKRIEETGNSMKKNFVLILERMTKRKRKIKNMKKLSRMKLSELKERA